MVPKKAKSKRATTKHRSKVQRKVNEHQRKVRRDNKLNPKRVRKDPGIPNLWPFKEKLLNDIEREKQRVAAEKQRQRDPAAANLAGGIKNATTMGDLVQHAQDSALQYDADQDTTLHANDENDDSHVLTEEAVHGRKDSSMRAYYREFRKVVDNADVILEVLDARDPLGCRTRAIEQMILGHKGNKRVVLVLNKIDLVPRENVEAWLKYLRNEFPTIAFRASTQTQRTNLGQISSVNGQVAEYQLQKGQCVGADSLIRLLKNYCRNANIKTAITVGVIGYPNVGKSSLINSLRRSRVCQVGAMPGVTKAAQEIHLDKNVKLLDSPGIVFAKPPTSTKSLDGASRAMADLMLRNCIKTELFQDPVVPVEAIYMRCSPKQLMMLYNLPYFDSCHSFLIQLARRQGRLKRGGIPNVQAAAQAVLNDWNMGRIQFYTTPPSADPTAQSRGPAQVVQTWSKEFDLDALLTESDSTALASIQSHRDLGQAAIGLTADSNNMGDQLLMTEQEMEAVDTANRMSDSDEDESMGEDGMDLMEEDSDMIPDAVPLTASTESQLLVNINAKGKKHALMGKASQKQLIMTPEEALLNPQTQKAQRQELKKRKKDRRRQEAALLQSLEGAGDRGDAMADDNYDFDAYFKPSAGGLDTDTTVGMDDGSDEDL
ncbi:nuclear GTP-binding protein nug1 [Dimargaris xerosporica]|nr:nuclear GTP-binding protein nug1 [Dimargaris xerosporica]